MFAIRRIHDDHQEEDRACIAEVQAIIQRQFPGIDREDIENLPKQLSDPLKKQMRTILFVSQDARNHIRGFALLMHASDLHFGYLDLISAAPGGRGRGIGSALYERLREEALSMGILGLFFECLPDDPALSPVEEVRLENAQRLAFYERFGARPIVGTAYETPLEPGADNPPYLVFDDLSTGVPLRRNMARRIVQAILQRKYSELCPPEYVRMVMDSFQDDPVRLRDFRYRRAPLPVKFMPGRASERPVALVVNDKHSIHHVRERGYVESPVRITSILQELLPTGLFHRVEPKRFRESFITEVHDRDYVHYLKRASAQVPEGRSIYPYTFPIRNQTKPPKELPLRAGYYCIDTFTPINRNAYLAAVGAVDCALTAAEHLLEGGSLAYALVRPPGHHAESRSFGGFCYFNSAAIAAQMLVQHGPVAMLDIDYHHGNGQEEIFYGRPDVLTISLHGPPNTTYPYFSGFPGDRGSGAGSGFNVNLPLPENVSFEQYLSTLARALRRVRRYQPRFLIICLGLDTAKGDPTGSWNFAGPQFLKIGQAIGELRFPTLVVQEGGYRTRSLGVNARNFFEGLHAGHAHINIRPGGKARGARKQTT